MLPSSSLAKSFFSFTSRLQPKSASGPSPRTGVWGHTTWRRPLHDYMVVFLCLLRQAVSPADSRNPQCRAPLSSRVWPRGDEQEASESVCRQTEAQKGLLCFKSLSLCVDWRFCSRPLEPPRPCQSPQSSSLCPQKQLSKTFILLGLWLTCVSPCPTSPLPTGGSVRTATTPAVFTAGLQIPGPQGRSNQNVPHHCVS